MSFIDLATLALHRRNELESRINVFVTKCDKATHDILKLKMKAQGFVNHLNCDPSELKDRFLQCMRILDEYIYLITDFNLSVDKLEEITGHMIEPPVLDTSGKNMLQPNTSFNIMDILCEATPSTSTVCPNLCPVEHKPKKIMKDEQSLITFSSNSCSSESMPLSKIELEKKYMKNINETMQKLQVKEPAAAPIEKLSLPAQTVLQIDSIYPAVIMNVDGPSLWIITDDANDFCNFISEMSEYYKENPMEIKMKDFNTLTYCAYHCDETDCYYRALLIRPTEGAAGVALSEVFLVDTGEVRPAGELRKLRALSARYCLRPPAARCCHLAGVDLFSFENKDLAEKQKQFLQQYIGRHCFIEVDDNTSESLGVYIILDEGETITVNELLMRNCLAKPVEKIRPVSPSNLKANSIATSQAETDSLADCPEYEDPLEAVTGYSNRDEAEICKHYKGGSEKSCFKGPRCKKRHVLMHPEGWTLDRVGVAGRVEEAELPAPGSWRRAIVTFVCHFDRLYVQLRTEEEQEPLPLPEFGVVIPPRNLEELVRDMNSAATRTSYKRLKMMPAPGELVAALYVDDCWYRARILSYSRSDQNVEVMYIDYGNQVWVREENVRALPERLCGVRAQATRCALAGVVAGPRGHDVTSAAKRLLNDLALDKAFDLRVIARDYDEITVELFDEKGNNLAEKLAESKLVGLEEFSVVNDSNVTKKIVVP